MPKKLYITTTLPYVNAEPHIGFALEIVRADAWVRFQRLNGNEVFFNTGVDEHGLKIYQKAMEEGLAPQEYCDQQVQLWSRLKDALNLSYDNFIRTTDKHHIAAVQEFWRRVQASGYIYKKLYKIKYCVGCELEKTDSELIDDKCPLHPNRGIEIIEEENYFFRFSAFQEKLLELYETRPDFVVPQVRLGEIKKFVQMGIEDFSVSRLRAKMPWGIEAPNDPEHIIYVWFDALINYISAIGWPIDSEKFNAWWPGVQIAGKDNLRQQAAMWQAMLLAADLPPSKQIFINGFITSEGRKMSKSLGNVISPYKMVEKFGVDGTRYLLLGLNTFGEDMDLTWEAMAEKYNADLANGLGNLLSRVLNLIENNFDGRLQVVITEKIDNVAKMENFRLSEVLEKIKEKIDWANKYIDEIKLWELVKTDKNKAKEALEILLGAIFAIGAALRPFLPETGEKIIAAVSAEKIQKGEALFPRIR